MAEYQNASEIIKRHSGTNGNEYVVCRFVQRFIQSGEERPADFGWPLTYTEAGIGWSKDGQVAFFDKQGAEAAAKETKYPISFDRAIHMSEIEWVVRAYSSYDGSSSILYSGRNYIQAEKELALGLLIKKRNHDLYLDVKLEGRTPI